MEHGVNYLLEVIGFGIGIEAIELIIKPCVVVAVRNQKNIQWSETCLPRR